MKRIIKSINSLYKRWKTWTLPAKLGILLTIFFGLFGIFSVAMGAYNFLNPLVFDTSTLEQQKVSQFNQHIRDVNAVISELKSNIRYANLYFENEEHYLNYNYRYTPRFEYTALEKLIESNLMGSQDAQLALITLKEDTRRVNVYLDSVDSLWQIGYTTGDYGTYHSEIRKIFEGRIKQVATQSSLTRLLLEEYNKNLDVNSFI